MRRRERCCCDWHARAPSLYAESVLSRLLCAIPAEPHEAQWLAEASKRGIPAPDPGPLALGENRVFWVGRENCVSALLEVSSKTRMARFRSRFRTRASTSFDSMIRIDGMPRSLGLARLWDVLHEQRCICSKMAGQRPRAGVDRFDWEQV